MNETLLNYIVQAILGGASGYITNDYAINMLFKEYTPLKLGGVIKKTRNEFIENLSSMVENDIINKEKLHEIFNSREFKVKFEKLTDDFYEESLYKSVGNDTFSDIDGFKTTLRQTDKYVDEIINDHIEGLFDFLVDNFNIGCFLTDLQSEKIALSLYNTVKDILNNTKFVENALKNFYDTNKDLKLTEVLGSSIGLINKPLHKFVELAMNNLSPTDLLKEFDFAANKASKVFYSKQIKDIINLNDQIMDSLISSVFDRQNIYNICQSLFSHGRKLDKSLYSLLDPDIESKLRTYIEDNLPYVTDLLVTYVQNNSILIDKIIEDSIDEVLNESQGLRARLLYTIKNTYFDKLSKKYSMVDKIITFIKQATEGEKLSINISKKIVEYLDTISISQIVREGEKNNFDADKAYSLVNSFISKNGPSIRSSIQAYISNLYLRDILPTSRISGEKILSSQAVKDFSKNKSEAYIKSLLSKELNNLIPEDKLSSYTNKLSSYIKVKFNENENSIKDFIAGKIKRVNIEKETFKNKEILAFIKREASDKYKEEAAKLSDVELSLALDKINSIDNISKNSSETLRKYVVKNTDTILEGSIKKIVWNNLNKLSDNELVSFANDFIGRELKPIMFFGGVLGLLAGLILAAFQNSPLDPGQINIATMATYAFVGFITNVIAINMIFKPYREIKFLSKIPFFRNFSLGYIIKNQKNFAKSTAHYIDKSLLSKDSINELFESHKSNIKNSFIKNIGENDYATLNKLLAKNKETTISGIYCFLKNNIFKNINAFSNYLYGRISKIKLADILTYGNINSISSYVNESLKSTDMIKEKIQTLVSSENQVNTLISTEYAIGLLNSQNAKLYDKALSILEPASFIEEISKHNERYVNYTGKGLEGLLNLNDEKLSSLSNKISKVILSDTFRDKFTLSAVSLFNKSFDKDKTFEELFDGRLKTSLDKKLPGILENLADKIKSNLAESKGSISATVRSEFKSNLGLLERGMYDLMGGDQLIDEIINKTMTDKLPSFMDAKKDEIKKITGDIVNEKFYKAKVEVLHTKLNQLQVNDIVSSYLVTNKEKIENKINTLFVELYHKAKDKEVRDILKLFNINDLNSLLKTYRPEINTFADAIHSTLITDRSGVMDELSTINKAVAEDFMNLKLSDIFSQVSSDKIEEILKNTSASLFKDDNMKKIMENFLTLYKEYQGNLKLDYFIDKDEFVISTENFIDDLLKNDKTEKTVKQILHSIIDEASETNFSFIDTKSKDYLVNIFVDSSIESLRRNLDDLLKSVEFDRLAAEEIEKMEPEKIHQMFDSFAGKYFTKLMVYGFGGFVFGINMYVGFTLTGLKIISEPFKKDS